MEWLRGEATRCDWCGAYGSEGGGGAAWECVQQIAVGAEVEVASPPREAVKRKGAQPEYEVGLPCSTRAQGMGGAEIGGVRLDAPSVKII
jgi:hypothetical protein